MNISKTLWPVLLILVLSACEQRPAVDRIRQQGKLLVATSNSPIAYYHGAKGPMGLEHDLVSLFAQQLGVEAEFVFYDSTSALLQAVLVGEVHMVAAGLSITRERAKNLLISTPYQVIEELLIYRRGSRRPRNLQDLEAGILTVPAKSSYVEKLTDHTKSFPSLAWEQVEDSNTDDLLNQLNLGQIDFTIANSNQFALSQHYYPYTKIAFSLGNRKRLAWGFNRATDSSLKDAADRFIRAEKRSNRLDQLLDRYYGKSEGLGFVDKRDFWRHVDTRLPKYQHFFKQAAAETGMDWRLLAAIGYQESHWDPDAVSPTGVRGMMMLTRAARKQLNITNGNDPEQSILGGARYIRWKEKKIPERITGDDRLWLTLASYNIGFGHLEDARILTQRQGGNPDLWEEVRKSLPLLTKEKYYSTLKHGYARGREPVVYVENIQKYYQLLIWHSNQEIKNASRGKPVSGENSDPGG